MDIYEDPHTCGFEGLIHIHAHMLAFSLIDAEGDPPYWTCFVKPFFIGSVWCPTLIGWVGTQTLFVLQPSL